MDDEIRTAAEALNQLHQEDPWFSYPEAVDLLSALDPGEVPALVEGLGDPSRKIRAAVARALGAYITPEARAALDKALADPERDVRRAAVGALQRWDDPAATAALGRIALDDPDLYTRVAAVQVLAGRPDPAAAGPLIALLARPGEDRLLLGAAAEALAGFGSAPALAPLVALLGHSDAAIREKAVAALAALNDPAAATPIRAYAAHEPDAYLAAQAQRVAGELEHAG